MNSNTMRIRVKKWKKSVLPGIIFLIMDLTKWVLPEPDSAGVNIMSRLIMVGYKEKKYL
jgi:hypothetical protein